MDKAYRWHQSVASRTLEGTAFVLLSGRMLSLNPVGTRIWEMFAEGATVQTVAERVVEEFRTSLEVATSDTQAFVGHLLERDLLVAADQKETGNGGELSPPASEEQ